MDSYAHIKNKKKPTQKEADNVSVPIFDDMNSPVGRLVPIGDWVLSEPKIIEEIMLWRKRAMRFFLSQFDPTVERTRTYLQKLSIEQPGRCLFLVFDKTDTLIGHIGLANVDGYQGELDNIMRGKSGGPVRLMEWSEKAILDWAFRELDLKRVFLRVLSYNILTINLHSMFGFKTVDKTPLFKSAQGDVICHEETTKELANVAYTSNRMELARQDFIW